MTENFSTDSTALKAVLATPPPARIFISYATADGAEAAARLRADLEARDPSLYSVWQDLARLEGGRDWWSQIEAAIRHPVLQHLVLIVTPAVIRHSLEQQRPEIARPVIRDELRLARRLGKSVIPIRGPGLDKLTKLPRWLGQVMDLDKPEHRETVLRMLAGPSVHDPVPLMAPAPPTDFVPRKAQIAALKADLLTADTGDAVAITAALRGTTGYGKTSLALALAADPDIEDAYFDGILWVVLGENGRGHVVPLIGDIIGAMGEPREDFSTPMGAAEALAKALGNKRILLIIDDVWNRADAEPFLKGGPKTTRLITTRFAQALPGETKEHRIGPMAGGATGEAWLLLASRLPEDQVAACKPALVELADRRHNWPQALRLANGYLRTRMGLSKHARTSTSRFRTDTSAAVSLADAIKSAIETLDARGSGAFDPTRVRPIRDADEKYNERHERVAEAMGLNLSLITDDARQRFAELAVFPEDVDVPVGMAARLWRETGSLDRHEAEGLLEAFDDASLLIDLDPVRGTFRFHDSVREYLIDQVARAEAMDASKGMPALHRRLINAMDDIGGAKAMPLAQGEPEIETAVTEYFYRHLPHHLAAAGDRKTLDALLLDPGWLQAKLVVTDSSLGLAADFAQYGQGQLQGLIGHTLRLISGICARDERQLLPQLLGRLNATADPAATVFLSHARRLIKSPALITQCSSLTPPGAEAGRLEGHAGPVTALAVLPDGRIASGSADKSVRLWDPRNGTEIGQLDCQVSRVRALATLPDGRIAAGYFFNGIRLLDPQMVTEPAILGCPTEVITALAVLPDGRLASSSGDGTVRVWDTESGAELGCIKLGALPTALAALPDCRLATGSDDSVVRFWDLSSFAETGRIQIPRGKVRALVAMSDGSLASSNDRMVQLWNPRTYVEIGRPKGSTFGVSALCALADGGLAMGSDDGSVGVWQPADEKDTARLEGHSGPIAALISLPNGQIASASFDQTLRLWDPRNHVEIPGLRKHLGRVHALTSFPDGPLISASPNDPVRFWNVSSGIEIEFSARPRGLGALAVALAALSDGNVATASDLDDDTIRVWDPKNGVELARLRGHTRLITAIAQLPDGRLASSSYDKTVRLWEQMSGAETACFKGHDKEVQAIATLPDGRLASGSNDCTVRVWDTMTGTEVACLKGHTGPVLALAVLGSERIASASADKTIRLWNLRSGAEEGCLEGHSDSVMSMALLSGGRLASCSRDKTIRVWQPETGAEICRMEVDAGVLCVEPLFDGRLVAGDELGRLHWLEVVVA